MKLKKLEIELQPSYSKNAGKYLAEIEYEGERGEVKMNLDPAISEALLAVIGPAMTKFTHQASLQLERDIAQSIGEANAIPAIEA